MNNGILKHGDKMQKLKYKNAIIFRGILLLISMLFVLSACSGNKSAPSGYATWTPSPSATPTCVPNIQLSTPDGWGSTSRLIVILYDPRTTGEQSLELLGGESTQDIPFFIRRIVPAFLKPSDEVAIFQLGYSLYDAARVTRLYSYTTVPSLYNTPSPRATLTPLPPTNIPTPGYVAVATDNFVRIESTKRSNIEAKNQAIYDCEVNYWNSNVKQTATMWNVTATAEIDEIQQKIDAEFELFNKSNRTLETPFRTNELYYGGDYYGLSFATAVFQADCTKHTECILILIDDLQTWGENNPDSLSIDLGGVKIYSILPNCKDIDQPSCVESRKYWSAEFEKFGALDMEYWNGTRVEFNLLNAIGR